MFKTILSSFFLLCSAGLFSNSIDFPKVLDLNFYKYEVPRLGYSSFNHAPEIGDFLSWLADSYQVRTVVETGTYCGDTTAFFSQYFDQVHTIETSLMHFNYSKARLNVFSNVHCYHGGSQEMLPKILPSLVGQRTLFYLDAHGESHWPILDELQEIAKTHKDNCLIVIDDFKVPGRRDIEYVVWRGKECSYEYIKDKLEEVFTGYSYFYVVPINQNSKAKFVAIPASW